MEADRPTIVDRNNRHLVWDDTSGNWVVADPEEDQDKEWYNRYPESFSGEDPARDTEIPDNPRSFGTFGSAESEHGFESVPTDNYNRAGEAGFDQAQPPTGVCQQCHQPVPDGAPQCPKCLWPIDQPPLNTSQSAGGEWSGGGFPERDPKTNYWSQGDNGTYGSVHESIEFGALPRPGQQNVGHRNETHRFVIDNNGQTYMEPATFEHPEIVKKYGIQENARGSVYDDGTADIHRNWAPINPPEVERQLGQQLGQHSVPLNYYPGKTEGQNVGMTAHGFPIGAVNGYVWKQENGIPHPQLAAQVPLVFAGEHTTPDDYPAYQNARGFLTATGGGTAHAVTEGRQRGMGGAVGIGPDYNKVQHGAPVSIRDDGTVELGNVDPQSTVHEYFGRNDEDWQNADLERQRREQEFRQRVPEWQRPTRGGSVYDKSNDELAIEAMTFGPRVAANLDECPECGDMMVDRNGDKICSNCGHKQKAIVMEATTKEGMGGTGSPPPPGAPLTGQQQAQQQVQNQLNQSLTTTPLQDATALAGGLAIPLAGGAAGLGAAGEVAPEAAAEAAPEIGAGEGALGEIAGGGEGVANDVEQGVANAPGRVRALLNGAKSMGKGMLIGQGIQSLLGGGQGGGGVRQQDNQGLVSHVDPRFDMWQYDLRTAEYMDDDNPVCPMCQGPGVELGALGPRTHYRCRNCGADFSNEQGMGTGYDYETAQGMPHPLDDPNNRENMMYPEGGRRHATDLDDPDSLGLLGNKDDGDGSSDRSTSDSMEETGDPLDKILGDLGDSGGSANRGAYSDDQKGALDHFNKNLPKIVELAIDDTHDHSDHPVIQELTQLLEHAFPGDDWSGGKGHDEHDADQHHLEDEAHDADKDDQQSKIGKTAAGDFFNPEVSPWGPGGSVQQGQGQTEVCRGCGMTKQFGQPCPHCGYNDPAGMGSGGELGGLQQRMPVAGVKEAHPNCTGEDCKFCANKGNIGGDKAEDEDSDVKESRTAWSVTDMTEADIQAIFTGEPVIEFENYPDVTSAVHYADAAHIPSTAMQPPPSGGNNVGMPVPPSGASPQQMTEQAQGGKCHSCGTDTVPQASFCHNCGTAMQGGGQQPAPPAQNPNPTGHPVPTATSRTASPAEHNPSVNPNQPPVDDEEDEDEEVPPVAVNPRRRVQDETLSDAFLGSVTADMHEPVSPQRVLPGPGSAIDQGHPWEAEGGQPLEEGKTYMMKSKNYEIPDEVTVKQIKPSSIVVEHKMNGGFSFPNEITKDQLLNDGLSFQPADQAPHAEVQQAQEGAQPDSTPGANEQTDLSTPTMTATADIDHDPIAEEYEAEPVDGLMYTDTETGDPVGYMEYAASLRASSPPELAWLWDNVDRGNKVNDRQQEMMQMTAGKNFTTAEQRDLINEQGEARNKDKLDLEGTHYVMDDDADELWFN